jgi:ribose transport system ATP-binding protein
MDAVIATDALVKDFGPVRALDSVTLAVAPGEVRGLVGENGAGKSTLMGALAGLVRPASGRILVRGREVRFSGPAHAQALGIAMIHQELNLVDELSIADNIFLGREITRCGFVRRRATHAAAAAILADVGCRVSPSARVGGLSIAQKQMVEIAKAASMDAAVLIMDEPTAVLTGAETASLFRLIRELKGRGVAVIYVSHILREVLEVCDRVTVLRDGRVTGEVAAGEATEAGLARMMVGRDLSEQFPPPADPSALDAAPVVLDVRGLSVPGFARDVWFGVRAGEVLGLAGLVGAGRTETAEAIVGLRPRPAGTITVKGRPAAFGSPREAARHGVAYLSEDRRGRGLTLGMGLVENTTMVSLPRYCRGGVIRRGAEYAAARAHVERLAIKAGRNLRQPVERLSGGTQQKVALAKWLEVFPDVLILDEPTRGVDVGAKREIYAIIRALADAGKACVMISSELAELLGMCDRIVVMRAGGVAGTIARQDFSEQRVMMLAAGIEGTAA